MPNKKATELALPGSGKLYDIVMAAGLSIEKGTEILSSVQVLNEKISEWSKINDEIIVTDCSQVSDMKKARQQRLLLRDERLDGVKFTKAKRKEVQDKMSDYTKEDKLWLKPTQTLETEFGAIETQLEEKEKFAEHYEASRKKKLYEDRAAIVEQYYENPYEFNLADMSDERFELLLKELKEQKERQEIENKRLLELQEKQDNRLKRLFELNLKFDGVTFSYGDIVSCTKELLLSLDDEQFRFEYDQIILQKQIIDKAYEEEVNRLYVETQKLAKEKQELEDERKRLQEEEAKKVIENKVVFKPSIAITEEDRMVEWINNLILPSIELINEDTTKLRDEIVKGLYKFKAQSLRKIDLLFF